VRDVDQMNGKKEVEGDTHPLLVVGDGWVVATQAVERDEVRARFHPSTGLGTRVRN
jgi:hypothetical protein